MAYASLQAMSPEPAAMMESPEVQDDPSSSSPSQPQENVPQSPLAVQAGPSTATGPAARYVPLVLGFALTPAFSHIRLCRFCTGCMAIVAQLLPPIGSPAEYVHLCCVASCTYCKSFGMLYKFALDDLCTVQIRNPQMKMTLGPAGSPYSHQQTLCPKSMLAEIYLPKIQANAKLHKLNLATLLLAQRSPNPEMAVLEREITML